MARRDHNSPRRWRLLAASSPPAPRLGPTRSSQTSPSPLRGTGIHLIPPLRHPCLLRGARRPWKRHPLVLLLLLETPYRFLLNLVSPVPPRGNVSGGDFETTTHSKTRA